MAGLLDTFFGGPDQTQALGLLGATMANGQGFGQGAANAMQFLGGADDRRLKRALLGAQVEETMAQAEERKRKAAAAERQAEFDRMFFGAGIPGVPGLPTSTGASTGAPAGAQPSGAGGFTAQQISQQYGIPLEAVVADYRFNGGKKIAELIADRSKPNWINVNGNLVNTNASNFNGGLQAGVSAGSGGQVTMWQPDGKGGLVVGAPPGAVDTFSAYQNIQEGTKANFDTVTVTPAGQPPQMTTRGALVRNPQVQGRVTPAQQAARDSDRTTILNQELTKAQVQLQNALRVGDQSGAARAQADIAALKREIGGRTASVGMPLQSPAEALRETEGVKGDATTNAARSKDVKTAEKYLSIAKQAKEVLESGPTASGIGSAVDTVAGFFGASPQGAVAAQRLKALGGWLVANVPRMEGPQSNFDVANYQVMAADVANDKLPIARRMAALDTITEMMNNTINGGPTGSWDEPGKPAAPKAGGWSIREKR